MVTQCGDTRFVSTHLVTQHKQVWHLFGPKRPDCGTDIPKPAAQSQLDAATCLDQTRSDPTRPDPTRPAEALSRLKRQLDAAACLDQTRPDQTRPAEALSRFKRQLAAAACLDQNRPEQTRPDQLRPSVVSKTAGCSRLS
eukprot:361463-Chlamydomonas_euryale.AAC.2